MDLFLDPVFLFVTLLMGESLFLVGLFLRWRGHHYNVPLYIAGLGFPAVLLGSQFSPPLMMAAVIFQSVAMYLDRKIVKKAVENPPVSK